MLRVVLVYVTAFTGVMMRVSRGDPVSISNGISVLTRK